MEQKILFNGYLVGFKIKKRYLIEFKNKKLEKIPRTTQKINQAIKIHWTLADYFVCRQRHLILVAIVILICNSMSAQQKRMTDPRHQQSVVTHKINPDQPADTTPTIEMKKNFVTIIPLRITRIDASTWEDNPPKISVYFTIKNNTLDLINGYVEASIGDEVYEKAIFKTGNISPNAEINGSITIFNPPQICYDTTLQISFFKYDASGQPKVVLSPQSSDVSHLTFRPITVDRDHDFVDDNLEDFLLEKFRPFFKFSYDDGIEQYRPCDASWYVKNSALGSNYLKGSINTDDCPVIPGLDQACVTDNPECIFNPSKVPEPPDLYYYAGRTNYHFVPSDAAKHGSDWSEILSQKKIGLYGHVVPVILGSVSDYQTRKIFPYDIQENKKLYYKVEYWQFFGYNYAHGHTGGRDYGDHEGDWTTIQLLIDARTEKIVSLFYYAHGQETRFDIESSMVPVVLNPNYGSTFLEYSGENANYPADDDVANGGSGHDTRNNRHVILYREERETDFLHPVVFIENGSHEFWPTADERYGVTVVGTRHYAASHKGDDSSRNYLTATPPNLGELEHPLNEAPGANLIMRYNGLWGCYNVYNSNPPGPTLHTEWTYPFNSKFFNQYNLDLEP